LRQKEIGTISTTGDSSVWDDNAQAGCFGLKSHRLTAPAFSGLQVKVLFGVGQNELLSAIENVPLWEQNAQAGCWKADVVKARTGEMICQTHRRLFETMKDI